MKILGPKNRRREEQVTTAIGICCKDGLVIGSDAKEVSGNMKRLGKSKIRRTGDIIIGAAGVVEEIKEVLEIIAIERFNIEQERIRDFRGYLNEIVTPQISAYRLGYLGRTNGRELELGLIIGTIEENGRPILARVYSDGGYDISTNFISVGTGAIFAEVLLRRIYTPEIEMELGKKFVGYLIWEMQTVDNLSGGDMEIRNLSKKKVENEASRDEIEAYKDLPSIMNGAYKRMLKMMNEDIEIEELVEVHKQHRERRDAVALKFSKKYGRTTELTDQTDKTTKDNTSRP